MNAANNCEVLTTNSFEIKDEPNEDFTGQICSNTPEIVSNEKPHNIKNIDTISKELNEEDHSDLQNNINDSSLLQKAKIYFNVKLQKLILACSYCKSSYQDVPIFIGHTCTSENPNVSTKESEKPKRSRKSADERYMFCCCCCCCCINYKTFNKNNEVC